jgi:hypothetical protein
VYSTIPLRQTAYPCNDQKSTEHDAGEFFQAKEKKRTGKPADCARDTKALENVSPN